MGASPALVAVAPTHEWRYIGSTSTLARAIGPLAPHDLDVARRLQVSGDLDWATLAAQQVAEKAVKAVLPCRPARVPGAQHQGAVRHARDSRHRLPRGRRGVRLPIQRLMMGLAVARCPRADIGEAPADYIEREQGAQAIADAEAVVEEAKRLASELGP